MAKWIRPTKAIRIGLLLVVVLVGLLLGLLWLAEYKPHSIETLQNEARATINLPDTFSITTWNIGYAGMDRQADFFMDGGSMVRRSQAQTQANLEGIIHTVAALHSTMLLLQEVDRYAKRSYYTDQYQALSAALPGYTGYFASNFKVLFVPIPLLRPIGRVHAGIATFGTCRPYLVERYAYPGAEPFPERTMQLKRCFVLARYCLPNGCDLVVINTHNSAFDTGNRRKMEMDYLHQILLAEYHAGNYVIAGGDWNQNPPQWADSVGTPEFAPVRIPAQYLPGQWHYVYDTLQRSLRFANKPYQSQTSLTSTVDFFIVSPNVQVVDVHCRAAHFNYSDHNPVTARFVLKDALP